LGKKEVRNGVKNIKSSFNHKKVWADTLCQISVSPIFIVIRILYKRTEKVYFSVNGKCGMLNNEKKYGNV